MASLLQGFKNLKASVGSAASEMQHIANQLQGSGIDEKRFLEAIYSNNCTLAASLLTSNPNVIYARTKDWHNAWHIAAQAGSLQMLDVLHTHGRGATRKPLPGEPPQHAAKTRDSSKTPLMLACAANHLNAMHYLLGVGASPRDGDKYGNTIVHYAALNGQTRMLSILLAIDEGASSDVMATSGGPGSNVNAVTRLVEVRNEAGLMPLHFAVWGGNPATVAAILEHGPDLVAKSYTDSMAQVTCNGGSTPLHVAALRNSPPMVDILLQAYVKAVNEGRGPRQDIRTVQDNYKFTPHSLALDLGREVVQGLLEPTYKLHGLDAAAAEATIWGDIGTLRQLRRSLTGAGASMKRTSVSSLVDDGFSALAAGALRSPGSRNSSSPGIGKIGKIVVPALTPPPPPTAKAGKAVAALLTPSIATSTPSTPIKAAHKAGIQADDPADATEEPNVVDPPSQSLSNSPTTATTTQSTPQPAIAVSSSPPLPMPTDSANDAEIADRPRNQTSHALEQGQEQPTMETNSHMPLQPQQSLPTISSAAGTAGACTEADVDKEVAAPLDARNEPATSQAASCHSTDFLCIGRSHICPDQEDSDMQCHKSASSQQPASQHGQQGTEQPGDEHEALQLEHEPTLSVQQGLLQQQDASMARENLQHNSDNQPAIAVQHQPNGQCRSSSPEHDLQAMPDIALHPSQAGQVYLDHTDHHTGMTAAAPLNPGSKAVSVALTSGTQNNISPSSSGDSSYCIVPAGGGTSHSVNLAPGEVAACIPAAVTAEEDANSVDSADYPPAEYLCPITNQFMVCPVIAADGRAYEEDAISMWISLGNTEFPGGGRRITSRHLTPATELQQQITAWRSAHGV